MLPGKLCVVMVDWGNGQPGDGVGVLARAWLCLQASDVDLNPIQSQALAA